jgi:hypothetical protein
MIGYSLISVSDSLCETEHLVYTFTLIYYVSSYGILTIFVINISDANDVPENYKDLAILQCSTAIALGILVMDIIARANDERISK